MKPPTRRDAGEWILRVEAEAVGLVLPTAVKGEGPAAGATQWTFADGWETLVVEVGRSGRIRWLLGAHVVEGDGMRAGEGAESLRAALARFAESRRPERKAAPRLRLVK